MGLNVSAESKPRPRIITNSESVLETITSAPMAWKSAIALLKARISVGQTTEALAAFKWVQEVKWSRGRSHQVEKGG
jgi:hypothetical protein